MGSIPARSAGRIVRLVSSQLAGPALAVLLVQCSAARRRQSGD